MGHPDRVSRLCVVLAALGLLLVASPSYAHSTDARIVSVVDTVSPALPAGIIVQARANLAAQLVASNPTDVPLEVLAPTGQPFLRISRAGVFGNLGSAEFFATSNPNGVAARQSGPGRFVQISTGSSWGWYDHRLHPSQVSAPVDARRRTRLAGFEVPMRYGALTTTVRGHIEFRPLLGQFEDTVTTTPAGLTASVLQGRLPGLFVTVSAPLTVLGRDGEPFLRSDGRALSVNVASRTFVEDQQARGLTVAPPSPRARWKPVAALSYTWLDDRLRYSSAAPPDAALRSAQPTTIGSWRVPVVVGDQTTAIAGGVRWLPADGAVTPSATHRSQVAWVAAVVAVVLVGGGPFVVRRRRR